jgi:hypothetical protein
MNRCQNTLSRCQETHLSNPPSTPHKKIPSDRHAEPEEKFLRNLAIGASATLIK